MSFVWIEDAVDELNILKDGGLLIVVAVAVISFSRRRELKHPQYKIEVILIQQDPTAEKSESMI